MEYLARNINHSENKKNAYPKHASRIDTWYHDLGERRDRNHEVGVNQNTHPLFFVSVSHKPDRAFNVFWGVIYRFFIKVPRGELARLKGEELFQSLRVTFLCSLLFFAASFLPAQTSTGTIAILDISARNNETNDARLFSVEYMLKVAGIPYRVTNNIRNATKYSMIMCTSKLTGSTFFAEEKTTLFSYVENGGTLFAPRIEDPDFFDLFGISGYEANFERYEMTWNETQACVAFRWIDEPEEWTVSLARSSYDVVYKSFGYIPTTAVSLAHFNDGTVAVTSNPYGIGHALSIGLSWKDIILRNQINRDYEAQRISSNGFEPTSDVFALFVRGVFTQFNPFAVWKHTSPGNSLATLMVTHDIDSRTGMDTLLEFADYEASHNIEATYFVTVRYFGDSLMSAFYLNRQSTMDYIKNQGHTLGSHSVGHFFDFADAEVFPIGTPGNTLANYRPINNGIHTVGGSIYGECELSKEILEKDCDVKIRTFRSGHLAHPKHLIDVLHDLGYEFNSSVSANDVLANFPFQTNFGRSFSGDHSTVYEIPMTISDVFNQEPISASNYMDKVSTWIEVARKNSMNGAPTTLLIHPNRKYKLIALSQFLGRLPHETHIMEMCKFGDFWKARESLDFQSIKDGNQLTVVLSDEVDLSHNVSFIINNGQSLESIVVKDPQGKILYLNQQKWGENDAILYPKAMRREEDYAFLNNERLLQVFPNPATNILNLEFVIQTDCDVNIDLLNIQGTKMMNLFSQEHTIGRQRISCDISSKVPPGCYLVFMRTSIGQSEFRKIVLI